MFETIMERIILLVTLICLQEVASMKPAHPEDFINPKLELRDSSIHGEGWFTKESIDAGEVLVVELPLHYANHSSDELIWWEQLHPKTEEYQNINESQYKRKLELNAINSLPYGAASKFNHGDFPNAIVFPLPNFNEIVMVQAITDIPKNTEVLWNYYGSPDLSDDFHIDYIGIPSLASVPPPYTGKQLASAKKALRSFIEDVNKSLIEQKPLRQRIPVVVPQTLRHFPALNLFLWLSVKTTSKDVIWRIGNVIAKWMIYPGQKIYHKANLGMNNTIDLCALHYHWSHQIAQKLPNIIGKNTDISPPSLSHITRDLYNVFGGPTFLQYLVKQLLRQRQRQPQDSQPQTFNNNKITFDNLIYND